MSFEKTFCSSPWIHTRISANGDYEYCRWLDRAADDSPRANIKDTHPVEWFQHRLAPIRERMLAGDALQGCGPCSRMEEHGKVSGRQKQLLKTGVQIDTFGKTMKSSPWMDEWNQSLINKGHIDLHAQDWQIDLGNYCNSACLFCTPKSSSRLASEQFKLGMIDNLPKRNWSDDPALIDRFIDALSQAPNLAYLHFIGGETLITPGFRRILTALITHGLNRELTLGFTTNLTVMDADLLTDLQQFRQINLGMSLECLDKVNDYVRYGGQIEQTRVILDQWLRLAQEHDWLVQLRVTPTVLTINRLPDMYEFAWQHKIVMESCNFLEHPVFMKPSVLPHQYRRQALADLERWIASKDHVSKDPVLNIRNPDQVYPQLLQDARSYVNYLRDEPDRSDLLADLVSYLSRMDRSRNNCVFDYLPEYEELFRSAGY